MKRVVTALLLISDLLLGDAVTLQHGACFGLLLTQRGDRVGSLGGNGSRRSSRLGRSGDRILRSLQGFGGFRPRRFRPGVLHRQQFRLGGADGARDIAVAAGLTSLALEAGELGVELAAQIPAAAIAGLGVEVRQVMFADGQLEA